MTVLSTTARTIPTAVGVPLLLGHLETYSELAPGWREVALSLYRVRLLLNELLDNLNLLRRFFNLGEECATDLSTADPYISLDCIKPDGSHADLRTLINEVRAVVSDPWPFSDPLPIHDGGLYELQRALGAIMVFKNGGADYYLNGSWHNDPTAGAVTTNTLLDFAYGGVGASYEPAFFEEPQGQTAMRETAVEVGYEDGVAIGWGRAKHSSVYQETLPSLDSWAFWTGLPAGTRRLIRLQEHCNWQCNDNQPTGGGYYLHQTPAQMPNWAETNSVSLTIAAETPFSLDASSGQTLQYAWNLIRTGHLGTCAGLSNPYDLPFDLHTLATFALDVTPAYQGSATRVWSASPVSVPEDVWAEDPHSEGYDADVAFRHDVRGFWNLGPFVHIDHDRWSGNGASPVVSSDVGALDTENDWLIKEKYLWAFESALP